MVAEHNWGGVVTCYTDCVALHWLLLLLLLLLCVVKAHQDVPHHAVNNF
jgi:hypothetical protein